MMKAKNEQTEPKPAPISTLTRRQRRELQVQRNKSEHLWIIGLIAATVLLLILVVVISNRKQQLVGGDEEIPTLGNAHVQDGTTSPIAYNSVPPTSGPHYGSIANWGIYREPLRYEQILHNLEDGGVVIYYQCEEECPEVVEQLEEVITPYVDAGRKIVLLPNVPTWTENNSQPLHQDMEALIAITAWQRIDKYNEFEPSRLQAFIERYEGIDNHR